MVSDTIYEQLYTQAEREFASRQGAGVLPFYLARGQRSHWLVARELAARFPFARLPLR